MRESRTYGSVRGARDEIRVPTATGVDGPLAASTCQTGVSKNHQEREPSMSEITTIGLDLAKHVFQVHGIDAQFPATITNGRPSRSYLRAVRRVAPLRTSRQKSSSEIKMSPGISMRT